MLVRNQRRESTMGLARTRALFISLTCIVMLVLVLQTEFSNRHTFGVSVKLITQYYMYSREHSETLEHSETTTATSIVRDPMNKINSQTLMFNGSENYFQVKPRKNVPNRRKLRIALYHVYHGIIKGHMRGLNMSNCFHYQNCEAVYIRPFTTGVIDAEAVLVQGNNIPRALPKHRDKHQVFIFVTVESPVYLRFTNAGKKRVHNYFNWTMTYRMDSDIPYVYGSVIPKNTNKDKLFEYMEINDNFRNISIDKFLNEKVFNDYTGNFNKNYSDIFRQKTETALWFVSHCRTASKREEYVKELAKYTNVTEVGKCNTKRSSTCPKRSNCDTALANKYKFFIAFENSLCTDYITEKAFLWFTRDIVIVVRGACKYEKYLPKGTYIDTNAFKSVKELAHHLNSLAANEEEYTKILKLKDAYTVITEQEQAQISYCNLCYKLNNLDQYRKSISNVNDWWANNVCVRSNDIR